MYNKGPKLTGHDRAAGWWTWQPGHRAQGTAGTTGQVAGGGGVTVLTYRLDGKYLLDCTVWNAGRERWSIEKGSGVLTCCWQVGR